MQVGVSTWYPTDVTGGLDADVASFFARLTTPPTAERASLYSTLILSLKSAGVWSKLDALWIMAAADSQAARLNLVSSSYPLTPISNPVFTVDRGYTGDGSASYLDTNMDTGAGGSVKIQRNSAFMGCYVNTATTGADVREMGSRNYAVNLLNLTSGMSFRSSATNSDSTVATFANSIGFGATNRNNSANHDGYRNGVYVETLPRASAILSSSNCLICAFNNNGVPSQFSTKRIASSVIGQDLTAGETLALYNAILSYLTAVGGN
ncbi:hypothetical protein [Rhizobium leguminosarum]|uniref:hypothetical protein n=1 Tax=Rhizobium leguminosarum TaxID=384 RepID=UPI001C93C1FE|nr:hypothetical protein [Rhizobium leguminosarum]MBY5698391.1 hypothetical protein [Rhizobium leguminosarum]